MINISIHSRWLHVLAALVLVAVVLMSGRWRVPSDLPLDTAVAAPGPFYGPDPAVVAQVQQITRLQRQQVATAVGAADLGMEVADAIWHASAEYQIPLEIILEVIRVESDWNPNLVHRNSDHSYDWGLMQLNDATWPWLARRTNLAEADPMNPIHNVQMGTWLLGYLHRKYGDWHHVLTAYNRGEGGLQRHVLANRSGETAYSRMVLQDLQAIQ